MAAGMEKAIREAKVAVRTQVRAALREMGPAERSAASAQACALLAAQARWQIAQSILFYAPMPEELNVWPLLLEALCAGKRALLPRFVAETCGYEACQILDPDRDVKAGHFGIREPGNDCAPVGSRHPDFILVPGVAFDLQGQRLGRGKGYYDQLLKQVRGTRCGVAFDQQIVNEIPVEPHDQPLDCLLTPTRWVELNS